MMFGVRFLSVAAILIANGIGGFTAELSLTLLQDAVDKGAVCLDGSPPGYYYRKGSTEPNKWIIHMEGGGYCGNEKDCLDRSRTDLGSSKNWKDSMGVAGFLSSDCVENPHFCGWSVVFIRYCDGGLYSGNVIHPVRVDFHTIYFRGIRILDAIIDTLLMAGVNAADHVILTGCSAGGLSTYLHLDHVRKMIPSTIPLHGFADAGYFIDAPNVNGDYVIRADGQYIYKMQNMSGGANQDCITAMPAEEEWKCGFANYSYPYIKTPLFTYNSAYDTWQLANILQLNCLPPKCSEEQMKQLEMYGQTFFNAATPAIKSPTNGVFIDSCVIHCQSLNKISWTQFKVDNQTAGDLFYTWLAGNTAKAVDCPYPCNPTCPKDGYLMDKTYFTWHKN